MIRRAFRVRRHIATAAAFTWVALLTSPALASGSSMPWEAPLQSILESIEGPVAKIVAVIIIIVTGLTLAFGDTHSFRIDSTSMRRKPVSSMTRMAASPAGCSPSRSICFMILPRCLTSPALRRRFSLFEAMTRTPFAGLCSMIPSLRA